MCKFTSPVAARYVQFMCAEIWNDTCSNTLTISGCPIGKKCCPEGKNGCPVGRKGCPEGNYELLA